MQINLNAQEINQALVEFIGNNQANPAYKVTDIAFTAGRGPNGPSATINLEKITGDFPENPEEESADENQQAIKFKFEEITE